MNVTCPGSSDHGYLFVRWSTPECALSCEAQHEIILKHMQKDFAAAALLIPNEGRQFIIPVEIEVRPKP